MQDIMMDPYPIEYFCIRNLTALKTSCPINGAVLHYQKDIG